MSSHDLSRPVYRSFEPGAFIHGGGVVIFHVKSERVVVVHHTKEDHWFLPKGRKDVGETSVQGAEREGFEESGFRNRVLPTPVRTYQTPSTLLTSLPASHPSTLFHIEPLRTDLFPIGRHSNKIQYICSWYIAETLPPDLEDHLNRHTSHPEHSNSESIEITPRANVYVPPPASPVDETLNQRMAWEPEGWEPRRAERSTVQSDELWYRAELMGVEQAVGKLTGTGMEGIVREGWRLVKERLRLERGGLEGKV